MAFAQALIEAQAVTALFETEVHEMMACRLEHDSSGSVECSVRLLWVTEGAG